jgi:hypothetical protein
MMQYRRRHLEDHEVHRRWIDPRMYELRVADVRDYLLSKGWKEVSPDRPGVVVFEEPSPSADGPLYQWIPHSEERREFRQAMYELLAALAEIEDRYAGDVLWDILESSEVNGEGPSDLRPPTKIDSARER